MAGVRPQQQPRFRRRHLQPRLPTAMSGSSPAASADRGNVTHPRTARLALATGRCVHAQKDPGRHGSPPVGRTRHLARPQHQGRARRARRLDMAPCSLSYCRACFQDKRRRGASTMATRNRAWLLNPTPRPARRGRTSFCTVTRMPLRWVQSRPRLHCRPSPAVHTWSQPLALVEVMKQTGLVLVRAADPRLEPGLELVCTLLAIAEAPWQAASLVCKS